MRGSATRAIAALAGLVSELRHDPRLGASLDARLFAKERRWIETIESGEVAHTGPGRLCERIPNKADRCSRRPWAKPRALAEKRRVCRDFSRAAEGTRTLDLLHGNQYL